MGCHTWFSVPYIKGKEEILKEAQKVLNSIDDPDTKQMYQHAIDKELKNPICDLLCEHLNCREHKDWVIYIDVREYCVMKYNKENQTNFKPYDWHFNEDLKEHIESYSDEPRVRGYPDTIISSYEEMVDVMKTGMIGQDGIIYKFYWEESRTEIIMDGLKRFFELHPDGIISFG